MVIEVCSPRRCTETAVLLLLRACSLQRELCLPSRCLAMHVYFGSAIQAFRRHVFSALRVCLTVSLSYDLFVLIKLSCQALPRRD
jgi:hypothetical protein